MGVGVGGDLIIIVFLIIGGLEFDPTFFLLPLLILSLS
jgi:hypothetical protein